jgi:hypothetical protein
MLARLVLGAEPFVGRATLLGLFGGKGELPNGRVPLGPLN